MIRRLRFTIIVSIVCALLAGCMPSDDVAVKAEPEISVVLESSTASLNPYAVTRAQRQMGHLVFRGLFSVDASLLPTPDLCVEVPTVANGGLSQDGRTVTYRLAEAEFHDGTTVTARDVVFTIEQQRAGVLIDAYGVDYDVIEAVEAVDARTVKVALRRPDAGLAWRLAPFVLPAHILEDSPDLLSDAFWLNPVGSGPYRVTDVRPGASLRLRAVGAAAGPEALDVALAPSQSAARSIFDSAPYAVWFGSEAAPAGQGERQDVKPGVGWTRLCAIPDDKSPASDPAVRAAVRMVIEGVFAASVSDGVRAPFGYQPMRSSFESTSQAEAALAASGWGVAADGIRERSGQPLELVLRTPALESSEAPLADAIKAQALSIGMMLEVRPSGPDYYGDFREGGVLSRAEGDFFLTSVPVGVPPGFAWPYRPDDVPSFTNPSGLNWQRLVDSDAARWSSQVSSAESPAAAVQAILAAWQQLDERDLLVWLHPQNEYVLSKHVQGVSANPLAEESLLDCANWTITE